MHGTILAVIIDTITRDQFDGMNETIAIAASGAVIVPVMCPIER
jgi:hypothetical protein